LTSIDGPGFNVIVIKPPMCFSIEDADVFLAAFQETEKMVAEIDFEKELNYSHTPT